MCRAVLIMKNACNLLYICIHYWQERVPDMAHMVNVNFKLDEDVKKRKEKDGKQPAVSGKCCTGCGEGKSKF